MMKLHKKTLDITPSIEINYSLSIPFFHKGGITLVQILENFHHIFITHTQAPPLKFTWLLHINSKGPDFWGS